MLLPTSSHVQIQHHCCLSRSCCTSWLPWQAALAPVLYMPGQLAVVQYFDWPSRTSLAWRSRP